MPTKRERLKHQEHQTADLTLQPKALRHPGQVRRTHTELTVSPNRAPTRQPCAFHTGQVSSTDPNSTDNHSHHNQAHTAPRATRTGTSGPRSNPCMDKTRRPRPLVTERRHGTSVPFNTGHTTIHQTLLHPRCKLFPSLQCSSQTRCLHDAQSASRRPHGHRGPRCTQTLTAPEETSHHEPVDHSNTSRTLGKAQVPR